MCEILFKHNIQSVIIEGGRQTIQTFIDANIWDEARIFKGQKTLDKGVKSPVIPYKNFEKQAIQGDELIKIFNHD